MKITVKNRFILFLFGWGLFPTEVSAKPKLWWQWLRLPYSKRSLKL